MSELKAHKAYNRWIDDEMPTPNEDLICNEVYLKSEADKVIAELKRQIEFLKVTANSCKNCAQCADGMGKVFDKEFNPLKDELRHQKYKRCLDKAELCRLEQERIELIENQDITDYDFNKLVKGFYKKWHKRWLELAEKFKEAK